MPNRWEHDVQHIMKDEIMLAVTCDVWQAFRVSLKGTTTRTKLDRLNDWLEHEQVCSHCERWKQVQVDNYINALKRGGQLDLAGNIVR